MEVMPSNFVAMMVAPMTMHLAARRPAAHDRSPPYLIGYL